jgi:hypothetical protein
MYSGTAEWVSEAATLTDEVFLFLSKLEEKPLLIILKFSYKPCRKFSTKCNSRAILRGFVDVRFH